MHSLTNCVASIPPVSLRTPPPFTQGRLWFPVAPQMRWKIEIFYKGKTDCHVAALAAPRNDPVNQPCQIPTTASKSATFLNPLSCGHPPFRGNLWGAPFLFFIYSFLFLLAICKCCFSHRTDCLLQLALSRADITTRSTFHAFQAFVFRKRFFIMVFRIICKS